MIHAQDRLTKILESPLLPAKCLAELRAFNDTVDANVVLIAKVLTDGAKEMPMKYETPERLARASFNWVRIGTPMNLTISNRRPMQLWLSSEATTTSSPSWSRTAEQRGSSGR